MSTYVGIFIFFRAFIIYMHSEEFYIKLVLFVLKSFGISRLNFRKIPIH